MLRSHDVLLEGGYRDTIPDIETQQIIEINTIRYYMQILGDLA